MLPQNCISPLGFSGSSSKHRKGFPWLFISFFVLLLQFDCYTLFAFVHDYFYLAMIIFIFCIFPHVFLKFLMSPSICYMVISIVVLVLLDFSICEKDFVPPSILSTKFPNFGHNMAIFWRTFSFCVE